MDGIAANACTTIQNCYGCQISLCVIEGEIDGERCMLENTLGRVRELSVVGQLG